MRSNKLGNKIANNVVVGKNKRVPILAKMGSDFMDAKFEKKEKKDKPKKFKSKKKDKDNDEV